MLPLTECIREFRYNAFRDTQYKHALLLSIKLLNCYWRLQSALLCSINVTLALSLHYTCSLMVFYQNHCRPYQCTQHLVRTNELASLPYMYHRNYSKPRGIFCLQINVLDKSIVNFEEWF